MNARRKSTTAVVLRDYDYTPDACIHALGFLLKKAPVNKKGGPVTAPDDEKEIKDDFAATPNHSM